MGWGWGGEEANSGIRSSRKDDGMVVGGGGEQGQELGSNGGGTVVYGKWELSGQESGFGIPKVTGTWRNGKHHRRNVQD